MLELEIPILKEYLYPTADDPDYCGYKETGRKGPLGYFTCSLCDAKFWHPDFDNYFFYELSQDIEVDCPKCKGTWVAIDSKKMFNIDVINKDAFPEYFAYEKADTNAMYQVYLNHSQKSEVVSGPKSTEENTVGKIGEISCPECLKKFKQDKNYKAMQDINGNNALRCTCERSYIMALSEKRVAKLSEDSRVFVEHTFPELNKLKHSGTIVDLKCGWCLQPFEYSKDTEKDGVIICQNCKRRAILIRYYTYDKVKKPEIVLKDDNEVQKSSITNLSAEQLSFMDKFLKPSPVEEIPNTADLLAGFFKH